MNLPTNYIKTYPEGDIDKAILAMVYNSIHRHKGNRTKAAKTLGRSTAFVKGKLKELQALGKKIPSTGPNYGNKVRGKNGRFLSPDKPPEKPFEYAGRKFVEYENRAISSEEMG